jgi:hypothetical protein
MPEPTHEERAGAQVYKATQDDNPSDRRKYRGAYVRKSGKVGDALNNITTIVQEGVGAAKPTGQHVVAPRGEYVNPTAQTGPATPDLIMGVAGGVVMAAEAVRAGRRARAKRKKERDGNS